MFTIDIHTHIIPDKIPRFAEKFGYGGFVHLDHHKSGCARMMVDDKFFREVHSNCWDAKVRIDDCDKHKVDMQVLSTIPVLFNYWAKPKDCLDISMFLNDHIAEIVAKYPDRFFGLATLPMQSESLAIKELDRCINKLNLRGVQIGTNVNGRNLNDPGIIEVLQAAQELNAAVFIHPWEVIGKDRMPNYWLPWLVGMPAETSLAICSMIFGGVFEKLPKLRVAFAHGGGSFPATIGRIEHGFNVRPDLCSVDNDVNPREYLGKFYLDSLVHDPKMLDYLVNLIGADKVALGTDYPFPLGELNPGALIQSMDYDQAKTKQLLSGNALDWLGVEKSALSGTTSTAGAEKK